MALTNIEKYKKAFMDSFELKESDLDDTLVYNKVTGWDSIGHMGLIDELEKTLQITLEADDIVDFSSFQKGKEIVAKYGVTLN